MRTITINVDDATQAAFIQRTSGHALGLENIAGAMLHQFAHHAPPQVVSWLAGQRGTPGDLWADFALQIRNDYRSLLAPEMALADAVKAVVAKR